MIVLCIRTDTVINGEYMYVHRIVHGTWWEGVGPCFDKECEGIKVGREVLTYLFDKNYDARDYAGLSLEQLLQRMFASAS